MESEEQTHKMKPYKKSTIQRRLHKRVGKTLRSFSMLKDKDKILVAVSGGKDSLCMLEMLLIRRKYIPVDFDLEVMHVLNEYDPDPEEKKRQLSGIFKKMDVPYFFENTALNEDGPEKKNGRDCFWCSWMRRRALFDAARKKGFNKIALGHNKDDIAQTILMNMLYNGNISGMRPVQALFERRVELIRPLSEITEEEVLEYSQQRGLILDLPECEKSGNSKRAEVKRIIDELTANNPDIRSNILRAPTRVRDEYIGEFEDV